MINIRLSQEAAAKVNAKTKECFLNSFRALAYYPDVTYIEGWIIAFRGLVTEHGWLEINDEIVDPTLILNHDIHRETLYFPGVRYNHQDALNAADKSAGIMPLVYQDGKRGRRTPSYIQAENKALQHARLLAETGESK